MPEIKIHEVYNWTPQGPFPAVFRCRVCGPIGSLIEAIKHAVINQFRVK